MLIKIEKLSKKYRGIKVFSDLSWELVEGKVNVITGPNGSGKSTFIRLLGGLERPSSGKISFYIGDSCLTPLQARKYTGLIAPDISLYDHLTPVENLDFFSALKGKRLSVSSIRELLEKVQLRKAMNQPLATFSSGMKQRLKLAYALFDEPLFFFMDEPATNLDSTGKEMLAELIRDKVKNSIILLATNEPEEVERFGQNLLLLDQGSRCPG
jgi:heme exporter protein A